MNRETWLHDESGADRIQKHYAENDTNVMPQVIDLSPPMKALPINELGVFAY